MKLLAILKAAATFTLLASLFCAVAEVFIFLATNTVPRFQ